MKTKMENKMMKAEIENKSAVDLHGLKPGEKRIIEVDREGTPLDKHFRRRLADSIIDGCVEITPIKPKKQKDTEDK